jgi:hypothetical protein
MSTDPFGWVAQQEEKMKEERGRDYFDIKEGKQQFVLLSHFAPYAQVFDNATKKYRVAEEGDTNVSVKGLCWVLQDGVVKSAKMPYTVVKAVKALSEDPEWDFKFPFPHTLTLNAEGAGTKEVKYSLTPSPKPFLIEKSVLDELATKPSPEDMVEKLKGKVVSAPVEYPEGEDLDPSQVGFGDE